MTPPQACRTHPQPAPAPPSTEPNGGPLPQPPHDSQDQLIARLQTQAETPDSQGVHDAPCSNEEMPVLRPVSPRSRNVRRARPPPRTRQPSSLGSPETTNRDTHTSRRRNRNTGGEGPRYTPVHPGPEAQRRLPRLQPGLDEHPGSPRRENLGTPPPRPTHARQRSRRRGPRHLGTVGGMPRQSLPLALVLAALLAVGGCVTVTPRRLRPCRSPATRFRQTTSPRPRPGPHEPTPAPRDRSGALQNASRKSERLLPPDPPGQPVVLLGPVAVRS